MYENFGNFPLIIFTISKIDFTKNFGPGWADPDRVVVVTREAVIGSRQPLHVVTDFPFYGFFLTGTPGLQGPGTLGFPGPCVPERRGSKVSGSLGPGTARLTWAPRSLGS